MLVRNFRPVYALALAAAGTLVVFLTLALVSPTSITIVRAAVPHISNPLTKQGPARPAFASPVQEDGEGDEEKEEDKVKNQEAHFEWAGRKEDFPLPKESLIPLPNATEKEIRIPAIQHVFEPSTDEDYIIQNRDRRDAISGVMMRGWKGYKSFAWLKDELAVKSAGGKDNFGGWAATLVDALDTLWVMDLNDLFEEAVKAVEEIDFTFSVSKEINTFETTIRYLGGLLSTHDLTEGKYPVLLEKATVLGDMLYASFDTPYRMPITRWEWRNARDGLVQDAPDRILLAELGSMSLEFTRLTQLTGDNKYYDAIQRINNELQGVQNSTKLPGLWPVVVNAKEMDLKSGSEFTLSSMADSMYESLPKQYMLLGGQTEQPRQMYEAAIQAAKSNLFYRPMTKKKNDILLSGLVKVESAKEQTLDPQGQHLSCYIAGMMGIGSQIFDRKEDMEVAKKLLAGCLWAYENTPAGIMPEVFHTIPCPENKECEWDEKIWLNDVLRRHKEEGFDAENVDWKVLQHRINPGFADIPDRRYILRPEVIESFFLLYRITGEEFYRDKTWELWLIIERVTKTRFGNAAVDDVTTGLYPEHADSMESFWMAETLKYFYLVFCDQDVLSLDEWVFNTEAHAFRRPGVQKKEEVVDWESKNDEL